MASEIEKQLETLKTTQEGIPAGDPARQKVEKQIEETLKQSETENRSTPGAPVREPICSVHKKKLSKCGCSPKAEAGAGGAMGGDNPAKPGNVSPGQQTSATLNKQVTPQLLFSRHSLSKELEELLKQGEVYEANVPLQQIKELFDSRMKTWAALDKTTPEELAKQGYSAKMQGDALVITIPDASRRENFLETLIKMGMINPSALQQNKGHDQRNSRLYNPFLAAIETPELRRE